MLARPAAGAGIAQDCQKAVTEASDSVQILAEAGLGPDVCSCLHWWPDVSRSVGKPAGKRGHLCGACAKLSESSSVNIGI